MATRVVEIDCIGCGACEALCPSGAISQRTTFTVTYVVDPLTCNDCRECHSICPTFALQDDPDWAVCHGRGCPLSASRYAGWECSEGSLRCDVCNGMLWRSATAEPWACPECAATRRAGCPKARRAARLALAALDVDSTQ